VNTFLSNITDDVDGGVFLTQISNLMYPNVTFVNFGAKVKTTIS
jgi:hypothetical protein